MEFILKTEALTKTYHGTQVVSQVNLQLHQAQVLGILGPNGSGKTTTLEMLVGAIRPTSGAIYWFGEKMTLMAQRKIGVVSDNPAFYPHMSAYRNLEVVSLIKKTNKKQIDEVLSMTGLLDVAGKLYRTFSLGMKRRLGIASALLGNPEVLILDEPTNGLDPMGITYVRELIVRIAAEGKAVILASHLLDEVQKVCSHVAVLKKGTIVYQGSTHGIRNDADVEEVEIDAITEGLEQALKDFSGVADMIKKTDGGYQITLAAGVKSDALNQFLFDRGIILSRLCPMKKNLEKQVIQLLSDS